MARALRHASKYSPLLLLFALCHLATSPVLARDRQQKTDRKLLLISLDGFRWDYLNGRARTPTFDAVKRQGVHVTYGLQNEYVTNTLPNHFTLVTGLHTESHGIVDNSFLNPQIGHEYKASYLDPEHSNHPSCFADVGTPIWVLHQKRGRRSGVYMWMGGEIEIQGVRPNIFIDYKDFVPELDKVNTMLSWLLDPEDPVDLGVLYINEPDLTAHRAGPESEEVTGKIEELDSAMGHLLQKLEENGLLSTTDIIITSDHGFETVSNEKMIPLEDMVNPDWFLQGSQMPGPLASIFPKEGKEDAVYQALKAASEGNGLFTVYRKRDLPERFHYSKHHHIGDVIAMAVPGYTFSLNTRPEDFYYRGNHGYDSKLQSMHPFFLAIGPSFKKGFSVNKMASVDVYPLMCKILGLEPAPNNGTLDVAGRLLIDDVSDGSYPSPWTIMYVLSVGLCGLAVYTTKMASSNKQKPM